MIITGCGYSCIRRGYGRAEHPAPRLTFKSPYDAIFRIVIDLTYSKIIRDNLETIFFKTYN